MSSEHVLVDLGDVYPRSVVLHKGTGNYYKEVDLFKIPGKIGTNCTGISIGGMEITKDAYITAINIIDYHLATEYTSFEIKGMTNHITWFADQNGQRVIYTLPIE